MRSRKIAEWPSGLAVRRCGSPERTSDADRRPSRAKAAVNSRITRDSRSTFTVAELERLWRLESRPPESSGGSPRAQILVRRTSEHDSQQEALHVSLDGQPLGTLRYGELIKHAIEPGPHTIRVSLGCTAGTLRINAEPGRRVLLQCGTGFRTARWYQWLLRPIQAWRVWLAVD